MTNQVYLLAEELMLPSVVLERLHQMKVDLCRFEIPVVQLTDPVYAVTSWEGIVNQIPKTSDDQGIFQLAIVLAAACIARTRYRQLCIPDAVFLSTMGCLRRFLYETHRIDGTWCFDRGFWTWRQVSLQLFRLGSLEFEYRTAGNTPLPAGLKEEDTVLSVHIPSDASMCGEDIADSYRQAIDFFSIHQKDLCFMGEPKVLMCSSWLLSPELHRLLPENSHIRTFAQGFEIFRTNPRDESFYRWLFDGIHDPKALLEKTSLQRAVKAHLLSGGVIGAAVGYRFLA